MTKFSDLKLDPKVLKAVTEAGYESPTPIQAGAIPPALEGRDVLGIAQTGTGKTASFTLPMITLLGRGRARARMPRSLVLCPTRELAAQVAENFDIYAKNTRLTKALLIGGVSFGEQDKLIDRGVDVLIATPGRLLDHFERGKLLLTGVQIMVVDEADRMLDMGFIPDIERIFQLTPFTRQTLFFSATMAPEIERITDTFLHSPERIEVARQATTSETITQKLVEIAPTRRDQSAKQKRELLRALIRAEGEALKNAIIFCNRKTDVDIVAKSLKSHGFDAAPIHGDLDQRHRMATLDDFREGKLRFLVASDVAARGLDIPAVSHVFNFDLPSHAEDYVHRIGRTGRAGRLGTAISIGTPADDKYLGAIEALVKQTLPRAPAPEGFTLSEAAQGAPRPSREGGRRERGGRGRRGNEAESRQQPDDSRAEPRESAEAAGDNRRSSRDEGRDDRRNDGRRSDGRRDHGRRDSGRDDRRGERHPVLGMGDHMPEFMTRSFLPSLATTSAARPAEDSAEEATPETAAEVTAESAAPESKEKPARRKRTPKAKAPRAASKDKAAEPEAATADAPAEPTAKDSAVETAAPADSAGQPATETPAAETPAAPEESAETPAAKPARKRKPRASKAKEPAAETAEATPEADPAQPETAGSEPAPTADEAQAEAAPAEKPKRKTARKAPAKPRAPRKSRAKAADAAESEGKAGDSAAPETAPAETTSADPAPPTAATAEDSDAES